MRGTRRRHRVALRFLAGAAALAAAGIVAGEVPLKTWPAAYGWHTFHGSSAPDGGNGVAADRSGRVTTVGYSYLAWTGPAGQAPLHAFTAGGGPNAVIVQTAADGTYRWHTFYPGALSGVSVDLDGNLYLTGSSRASWLGPAGQTPLHAHPGGAGAIVVMKLDASGAYRWHTFYGSGHPNYGNNGTGIAADSWGTVSVTGDSAGGSWKGPAGQNPLNPFTGSQDAFVLRLDANGAYQWHAFYGSGGDGGRAIAVDSWGVDVVGYSGAAWNGPGGKAPLSPYRGDAGHASGMFVLKLNANGTYAWHTFHGAGCDTGFSITPVSGAGFGIYVAGRSWAPWNGPAGQAPLNAYHGDAASPFDQLVLKLSRDGAYQWHTFYGTGADAANAVSTGLDTVYVAGASGGTWNGPAGQPPASPASAGGSVAVLALGTDGAYRWHGFFGAAASGQGLAVSSGAVYVAGGGSSTWSGPAGQPPVSAPAGSGDVLLMKVVPASPSLVLSDEGAGLVARLVAAGYGALTLYDGLVQLVSDTNPSVSGIITPAFLAALQSCPADSGVFTTLLEEIPPGRSVAIASDGTWRLVDDCGLTHFNQPGTDTLPAMISGVGTGLFTCAGEGNAPLTSFTSGGTTYNIFAIVWAPRRGTVRRVIADR